MVRTLLLDPGGLNQLSLVGLSRGDLLAGIIREWDFVDGPVTRRYLDKALKRGVLNEEWTEVEENHFRILYAE